MKDYATQRTANFFGEVTTQLGVGTAVNFTLGVNNAAQGTVLVQGVPVGASTFKMYPNIPFTLKAVPAPGYAFSSWTGAASGTSASISATITGAATITANFVREKMEYGNVKLIETRVIAGPESSGLLIQLEVRGFIQFVHQRIETFGRACSINGQVTFV